MKKKIILSLLVIFSLFTITGCSNSNKTKISCIKESYLFHSKKSVEHIIFLNNKNQLINYQKIEKYYSFDDDNDFEMICEGSYEEAENNNKIYDHLKEVADCNRELKEVTISDEYDISKLKSKNVLPSDDLKTYLSDNYILDLENYKNTMTSKEYICNEL